MWLVWLISVDARAAPVRGAHTTTRQSFVSVGLVGGQSEKLDDVLEVGRPEHVENAGDVARCAVECSLARVGRQRDLGPTSYPTRSLQP